MVYDDDVINLNTSDEDKERAKKYYTNNIDSLIKQCKNGLEEISYVSLFSFLEGYFRNRFPEKLGFSTRKHKSDLSLPKIIKIYINTFVSPLQQERDKYEEHLYLIELDYLYDKTNPIRHSFNEVVNTDKLKKGDMSKAVNSLKGFFSLQDLSKEQKNKFDEIYQDNSVLEDSASAGFLNFFSDSREDFFAEYDNLVYYLDKKLYLENNFLNVNKFSYDKFKKYSSEYSEDPVKYDEDTLKYKPYEVFLNEFNLSIEQEKTSRGYEKTYKGLLEDNPQQEEIVNECFKISEANKKSDPILITGAPGTGKSIVLIKCLFNLYEKSNSSFVLLTFSDSLEKYNKFISEQINKSEYLELLRGKSFETDAIETFKKEKISPFSNWMSGYLYNFFNYTEILSKTKKNTSFITIHELNELIKGVKYQEKKLLDLSDEEYSILLNDVWPNLKDADERIKDLHNKLDHFASTYGKMPIEYAYWKFAKEIQPDTLKMYQSKFGLPDIILIDEVQDLSKAQLECAIKLANQGCILAGDLNQCVKRDYKSWQDLGLDENVKKLELSKNYRTSFNIQNFSNEYLKSCGKTSYALDMTKKIRGPKPQLFIADNDSNACLQIVRSVEMLKKAGINLKDIYIAAPDYNKIYYISKLLKERFNNINVQVLKSHNSDNEIDFSNKNVLKLGTIESIKGIDCPILLFLLSEEILSIKTEKIIQDSLYTITNRAMHLLEVFSSKTLIENIEKPTPINNFINIFNCNTFAKNSNGLNDLYTFFPEKELNGNIVGKALSNQGDKKLGSIKKDLLVKICEGKEESIFDYVYISTIFKKAGDTLILSPSKKQRKEEFSL